MTPKGSVLLSPKRVLKAYEQVAEQIKGEILEGRLKPGDKLPTEEILSKQFGVARPTIREALRILGSSQLIDSSRGPAGGTFVRQPSQGHIIGFIRDSITVLISSESVDLSDLLEARELVEIPSAEIAAKKRSPAGLERMREFLLPGDFRGLSHTQLRSADIQFHQAIAQASGNPLVEMFVVALHSVYQVYLLRWSLTHDFMANVISQHEAIYEAIKVGDAAKAGEAMRLHISYLKKLLPQVRLHLRALQSMEGGRR